MIELLKNKKVLFFDVGFTLDRPASGDWMFTKKFYEILEPLLEQKTSLEISQARESALTPLLKDHLVRGVEEEYLQFCRFYTDFAADLKLDISSEQLEAIARDRTFNMNNYIIYEDAVSVLSLLSKTHTLGVISDTWPSITDQLKAIGVWEYFSFFTFSCDLGIFKPDDRIFLDALKKCGCSPEETVFIDDSVANLAGAAKLGITPILIAANTAADVETEFKKIYSLSELLD